MSTRKSPGTFSTEQVLTSSPDSKSSTVIALPVSSVKGPVDELVMIRGFGNYISVFGEAVTEQQRRSSIMVSQLLATGIAVAVIRLVDRSSTIFASTEKPSDEQIREIRVEGDSVVIENKQAQFTVTAVFESGQTQDLTADSATSYAMVNPNFGTVANGVFFAANQLGAAIISINVQGNVLQHTIDVVQLAVDHLDLIGPVFLGYGQAAQYRAIAYFVDGTARDVTFDPETLWLPESGSFTSINNGLISGITISVDSVNQVRIVHKNVSEILPVTIKPTVFTLFDAGDALFEVGTFEALLSPTYEGEVLSHTVVWEIGYGIGASLVNPGDLDACRFVMGVDPDNFFEVTLYIDRNTVNEQSSTVIISRSAYSPVPASSVFLDDFRTVMQDQGRVDTPGALTESEFYEVGPSVINITTEEYPVVTWFQLWDTTTDSVNLYWLLAYDSFLIQLTEIELQVAVGNTWVRFASVTDAPQHLIVDNGYYRLRLRYTQSHNNRHWKLPESRIYHSESVKVEFIPEYERVQETVGTYLELAQVSADISDWVVEVTRLIKADFLDDTALTSYFGLPSSNESPISQHTVELKRLVALPTTNKTVTTRQYKVGTNSKIDMGDVSNWDVTILTNTS